MSPSETFRAAWEKGDLEAAIASLGEFATDVTVEDRVQLAIDFGVQALDEDAGRGQAALRVLEAALQAAKEHDGLLGVRILDLMAQIAFELRDHAAAIAHSRAAIALEDRREGDSAAVQARFELLRDAAQAINDGQTEAEASQLLKSLQPPSLVDLLGEATRGGRAPSTAMNRNAKVENDAPFLLVPVHFATHRNRSGRSDPYDYFRGQHAALSFGKAVVSVPRFREVGSLEKPPGRGKDRADPEKHLIIEKIDGGVTDERSFYVDIRKTIAGSKRKEALLFIHGYNTTFASALLRAAQLRVDLEIDGASVVYSWPSKGSLRSYIVDRAAVGGAAIPDLARLIVNVATDTGAERVHLIAHSMGAEFLLDALLEARTLHTEADGPLADEVIFGSPDVESGKFSRVKDVHRLSKRITVYASERDWALRLSHWLQRRRPRAGMAAELVAQHGIDAVDTTLVSGGGLGHDDFAGPAIDDVRALVWLPFRAPPAKRAAILKPDEEGGFWRFHPEPAMTDNGDGVFRLALYYVRRLGLQEAQRHVSDRLTFLGGRSGQEEALRLNGAITDQFTSWLE